MEYNNDFAVRVNNLSKSYRIIRSPWQKLQYYLFHRNCGQDFFALKDVSFEIKKGETFGIIGVNGSGKSTLLQVLAGIIPKTGGEMEVSGKISALLELGSGFNPENTGIQNIYLNAAILGVTKENIDRKCDEIVAFADIGEFINEPVKTYSSGMFIRLAFAVAINVDADIIIIDEALAVGDIFFRQKCYAKLNEMKAEGKTIILVSHGMNEVEQFCDRALLLNRGEQVMLGNSGDVVEKYYLLNQEGSSASLAMQAEEMSSGADEAVIEQKEGGFFDFHWNPESDSYIDLSQSIEQNNGMAHYFKVGIFDENGKARRVFRQGEYGYFYSEVAVDKDILTPINGIILTNEKNVIVHGKNSFQTEIKHVDHVSAGSIVRSCIKMKMDLAYGEYTVELGFCMLPWNVYNHRSAIPHEELNESLVVLASRRNVASILIQGKAEETPSQLKFYGLIDLESEFGLQIVEK